MECSSPGSGVWPYVMQRRSADKPIARQSDSKPQNETIFPTYPPHMAPEKRTQGRWQLFQRRHPEDQRVFGAG